MPRMLYPDMHMSCGMVSTDDMQGTVIRDPHMP